VTNAARGTEHALRAQTHDEIIGLLEDVQRERGSALVTLTVTHDSGSLDPVPPGRPSQSPRGRRSTIRVRSRTRVRTS